MGVTRRINGNTYDEIAIVAAQAIPVDIQGATIDLTSSVNIGAVTVNNSNAAPVPISDAGLTLSIDDGGGSVTVDGPLTDSQLRAAAVPVSLASAPLPTGAASAALQGTGNASLSSIDAKVPVLVSGRTPVDGSGVVQPVSGPLTETQLRASPVPVSGPLTEAQLRATAVAVTGALTDVQLRASAVPVVGTVAARAPTTTSVAGTASSTLILAANANRKGLCISNVSSSRLYLSFSSPASVTSSFCEMQPGAFLLFDQQLIVTNAVYGVWTNANGSAQVTEFV